MFQGCIQPVTPISYHHIILSRTLTSGVFTVQLTAPTCPNLMPQAICRWIELVAGYLLRCIYPMDTLLPEAVRESEYRYMSSMGQLTQLSSKLRSIPTQTNTSSERP